GLSRHLSGSAPRPISLTNLGAPPYTSPARGGHKNIAMELVKGEWSLDRETTQGKPSLCRPAPPAGTPIRGGCWITGRLLHLLLCLLLRLHPEAVRTPRLTLTLTLTLAGSNSLIPSHPLARQESCANVDCRDMRGMTPLALACMYGRPGL
ncbi:unnamed protein product, partial [Discosporangium mesarthrocarpum]